MLPGSDARSARILAAALKQRGWKIFTRAKELNIVGVRHPDTNANTFNDTIHVFYQTGGRWMHHAFPATTDPGTYWRNRPAMPQGTAILAEQQADAYELGLHRGSYTALVQRRAKVEVIRDPDRDEWLNFNGKRYRGYYGMNIHRANKTGITLEIDRHSAGCQVFADATDYALFIELCKKHRQLYGNKFTYSLIDLRSVQRVKALRMGGTLLMGGLAAIGGWWAWNNYFKLKQPTEP